MGLVVVVVTTIAPFRNFFTSIRIGGESTILGNLDSDLFASGPAKGEYKIRVSIDDCAAYSSRNTPSSGGNSSHYEI